jgi:hypothetical protein
MPLQWYSHLFDHSNNILWRLQFMKLFSTQFRLLANFRFLFLKSQSVIFCYCERSTFKTIPNAWLDILLWVEPLRCNDHEISKYTGAFSRQRRCKHVLAETDRNATMAWQYRNGVFCGPRRGSCVAAAQWTHLCGNEFRHNNRRAVFSVWSVPRGYKRDEV